MNSPPSSVVRPSAEQVRGREHAAAGAARAFEDRRRQTGLLQLVGGVEPGHAAADDGDARRAGIRLGRTACAVAGGGGSGSRAARRRARPRSRPPSRGGTGGACTPCSMSSSTADAPAVRGRRWPPLETRGAGNRTVGFVTRHLRVTRRRSASSSSGAQLVDTRQHRAAVHLAIRLRQHLARGALLDGDENLQLALERAGRRNEVLERLPQRLDGGDRPSPPLSSATSSARARIASMSAPDKPARVVDHFLDRLSPAS